MAPYLERYFTVPHGRDFSDLAAAYGWEYSRVGPHDESSLFNDESSLLNDFIAAFETTAGGVDDGKETDSPNTKMLVRRIIEVDLT